MFYSSFLFWIVFCLFFFVFSKLASKYVPFHDAQSTKHGWKVRNLYFSKRTQNAHTSGKVVDLRGKFLWGKSQRSRTSALCTSFSNYVGSKRGRIIISGSFPLCGWAGESRRVCVEKNEHVIAIGSFFILCTLWHLLSCWPRTWKYALEPKPVWLKRRQSVRNKVWLQPTN